MTTLDAAEEQWQYERPDLRCHPERFGWEPYPLSEFAILLDAAIGAAPASSFLDVGCGVGTKCRAAALRGLVVAGVETVAEYADVARAAGVAVEVCDVYDYARYGGFGIVYVNCPFRHEPDEAAFETWLHRQLAPGAVLIAVNSRTPPPFWQAVVSEPALWRGVYVKPTTG